MHFRAMVKTAVDEFKQKIEDFCRNRDDRILTPEFASEVARGLQDATLKATQAGTGLVELEACRTKPRFIAGSAAIETGIVYFSPSGGFREQCAFKALRSNDTNGMG